jgi:hypothetical protein
MVVKLQRPLWMPRVLRVLRVLQMVLVLLGV